jgi:hypothetical protein
VNFICYIAFIPYFFWAEMFPSDGLFLLKAVDGGKITSSFYLGLSVFLISFFSTTGD